MSALLFTLQRVTSSQELASLASVEAAAMLPQPFNTCYFRTDTTAERQETFFKHVLEPQWANRHVTQTRFLKAVNQDSGEVEGFVIWTLNKPHNGSNDTKELGAHFVPTAIKTSSDVTMLVGVPREVDPSPASRTSRGLADPDNVLVSPQGLEMTKMGYAVHKRITKRFIDAGCPWIYLDKMYVRPRSQNRGLAKALWCEGPLGELVETQLPTDSAQTVPVVTVSIGASRLFYESIGFRAVEPCENDLREGGNNACGSGEPWFTGMVHEAGAGSQSSELVS